MEALNWWCVVYMDTDHTSMHMQVEVAGLCLSLSPCLYYSPMGSWMDWVNGYTVWLPVAPVIKGLAWIPLGIGPQVKAMQGPSMHVSPMTCELKPCMREHRRRNPAGSLTAAGRRR